MFSKAFALPIVMIASVVMMMVLVSGLSATTSVNSGLRQQHAARLQKAASEAGLAMASYCIKSNSGSITWTNAKPLKPNTDCNGDEQFSCTVATPPTTCYVAISGNTKTSFSVGVTVDGSGNATDIDAKGVTINVRGNGGSIQSSNSSSSSSKIAISGQSGSGSLLSANQWHTCVVAVSGSIYCWGQNLYGESGNGTTTGHSTPLPASQGALPSGAVYVSIGKGDYHACAIATDSNTYCWGENNIGQLGNGTTTNSTTPVAVSQGALPAGSRFKQITAGEDYTCAIATNDRAYCWGRNTYGGLGAGSTTTSYTPLAVSQGVIPAGVNFTAIASGEFHTCAIATNDRAYCWGYNPNGQLGNGTTTNSSTPVAVSQGSIPAGVNFKQISVEDRHTCAIATNDRAYCWGEGTSGQLGNGAGASSLTPVAVSQGALPAGVNFKQISVGYLASCAIATNDRAYCWGINNYGQAGMGSLGDHTTPVAVLQGDIPAGVNFAEISSSNLHVCATATNNRVYCWGYGQYGQIGNGSTGNRSIPTAVTTSGWSAKKDHSLYVGMNLNDLRF